MRRGRRGAAAALATLLLVSGATWAAPPASAAVPTSFTLHGSGFGHGVGMPQFGAYQMAREGSNGSQVLAYYYTGTRLQKRAPKGAVSVQVYGPEPYGFSGYADTADRTQVTVSGGSWRLARQDGTTVVSGSDDTLTVGVREGRTVVRVNGTSYRANVFYLQWSGTREFRPTGSKAVVSVEGAHGTYRNGRLELAVRGNIPNITNRLLLDTEYLYGIAEMPSSWGENGGAAALRAQAITARSYAWLKLAGYKNACRCHLVDDVRDQHFTGWKKQNEGTGGRYGAIWVRAVNATRSSTWAMVLTYAGEVVATHYYSSSGGRTADSEDVWSAVVPYERSVADPYSRRAPGNTYASWTRRLSQAQASRLFGLPNVDSIRITARWTSGQVRTLVATSSSGKTATLTGKADTLRSRIGARTTAGNLPAAWIGRITENA